MTNLSITSADRGTSHVLALVGELELATVAQFREVLRDLSLNRSQQLIIDMTGLEFCDSSGMTALLTARARASAAHASIALAGVPSHLVRALTVVGLDQIFPSYATTTEAITDWDASTR
jgi:anti-anti-sigma factor